MACVERSKFLPDGVAYTRTTSAVSWIDCVARWNWLARVTHSSAGISKHMNCGGGSIERCPRDTPEGIVRLAPTVAE